MANGLRPCTSCNGSGICGRRDLHFFMAPGATVATPSHDDYSNSYRNHICCLCKGQKYYDCDHVQNSAMQVNWNSDTRAPMVKCLSCGTAWTGIPIGTRIHSGMWPILVDSIKEYVQFLESNNLSSATRWENKAKDIMNQYLDWRPASEKQTMAEKVVDSHLPRLSDSNYTLLGCHCGWTIPNDMIVIGSRERAFSNHLLKSMRTSSGWNHGIDWAKLATEQGIKHQPQIKSSMMSSSGNRGNVFYISGCTCGYKCTSSDTDTEFVEHVVYMTGPDPIKDPIR